MLSLLGGILYIQMRFLHLALPSAPRLVLPRLSFNGMSEYFQGKFKCRLTFFHEIFERQDSVECISGKVLFRFLIGDLNYEGWNMEGGDTLRCSLVYFFSQAITGFNSLLETRNSCIGYRLGRLPVASVSVQMRGA